jgi:phosphoglycolate phosphatase
MPRLVLWDVDHTLIENAGVSKEIYAAAFTALTGRTPSQLAPTEGRTDPDIMAELLRIHEAPSFPWPQVEHALAAAGAAHRQALAERGAALPGVVELIATLATRPRVVQTIVTGNIRANAEVKLAALGLHSWLDLDVGGYGSDDRERFRLVATARTRAAAKYGRDFDDAANAVVIGDTPRDIEAARGAGTRILAVASGIHEMGELRAAGATCVMSSLANTAAVLDFVLNSSTPDAGEPAGTR